MVPLVMVIALLLGLTVGIVEINVVQLVQNNVGHAGETKNRYLCLMRLVSQILIKSLNSVMQLLNCLLECCM